MYVLIYISFSRKEYKGDMDDNILCNKKNIFDIFLVKENIITIVAQILLTGEGYILFLPCRQIF